MIISHKHKFAFVHNPKAGGTSIRKALTGYHDHPQALWHQGWLASEERVVDLAHLPASTWTKIVDPEYTTFGFVRDPYTRFVASMAEFQRRHGGEFTVDETLNMLTPANIRYDWRFIHFCPQHVFFFNKDERVVKMIGRLEDFPFDWETVTNRIGLGTIDLPRERSSAKTSLVMDDDTLDLIFELYHLDFVRFGYLPRNSKFRTEGHAARVELIHNPNKRPSLKCDYTRDIEFSAGESVALNSPSTVIA
jgi:hypothetical protein